MKLSPPRPTADALDSRCRWPLALVIMLLALRVVFLFRHGVDSDEAQHLHVIYEWSKGALPYRDVFDNHTPFFHWLFLPLAWLVGENPNVILLARLAQVPISFGVVGLFYLLARRLYNRATALWALALVLSLADWSLKALEFRPDVLWTALWFSTLVVLVRGPGWRTFFPAGFLFGVALMVSVKTTLLMAALGLGWAGAWALSADFRRVYTIPRIVESAFAAAAGLAIVPGLFLGWFAAQGALSAMRFCLFTVNQPESPVPWRVAICVIGLPITLGIAWRMLGNRAAVFLAAAAYTLLVIGFSPSLKKQTFLPVYPLLILAGVGAAEALRWRRMAWLETSVCVGLLAHQVAEGAPWRDGMAAQRALLQDTLAMTGPNDYLFDLKGETIFRRRPIFLAYVLATSRGVETGRLAAQDPADLTAKGTAVVIGSGVGFPAAMRNFLKGHYLPAGNGGLRVAGDVPERKWAHGHWEMRADLPVPGDYVVLADGLKPVGVVRVAAPGRQVLAMGAALHTVVYWKSAWDKGYRPKVSDISDLRK